MSYHLLRDRSTVALPLQFDTKWCLSSSDQRYFTFKPKNSCQDGSKCWPVVKGRLSGKKTGKERKWKMRNGWPPFFPVISIKDELYHS